MICIDSNCIIDFLRNKKEAVDIVNLYKDDLVVTEINIFEIFLGIYNKSHLNLKEEQIAIAFFNSISKFSLGTWGIIASKLYSSLIKSGNLIELNDCYIASIMLANGCNTIITRNKKHFERITAIKVIHY